MNTQPPLSAQAPSLPSQRIHQCLFHPQSIAVIGASSDPLKPGGRVFKSIHEHGYAGELWPINPKATEILSVPAYASLAALPGVPDLAIIAIPSPMVPATVTELARRGVGATIVLTSGFGEKDAAGKKVEEEMRRIADTAGMALIGPNCSGFLTTTYKGKFAGIVPQRPGGAIDFISGSGATVDYLMECADTRGLSFGTVINLGNSVQLGVEDLVALYDDNYDQGCARILLLYMEAVKKPQLLLRHAQSLARKGCVIAGIKAGTTAAGARAAASHTGAMATSDTAVEALFDKAGILRVAGRGDLIDVACVLRAARGRMRGKRLAIVTDAGGPGVMLADQLARCGLEVATLTEATQLALANILPPESSLANPIDALPSRTAEQIKAILKVLGELEKDHLDGVAVLTGDSGLSDNGAIYEAIAVAMDENPLPVFPVLSSLTSCREKIAAFTGAGKVFFPDEVSLGRALGAVTALVDISQSKPTQKPSLQAYDRTAIAALLRGKSGILEPALVRAVLDAAGFALPEELVTTTRADLAAGCRRLGFPLVMKVIGPLHKTDVGGVRLNITSESEAETTRDQFMAIPTAKGVLLQPMVDGLEVILGVSREGEFGHLLMFGLGGIHTEVLKDVRFALAPLSQDEARRMIDAIRGRALLDGVRGGPAMNIDRLVDFLVRLGCLVSDFPQIAEIDLNPVKGSHARLLAVDARIIIAP
jgi:acyl-CoA synthetase (NDP forming)